MARNDFNDDGEYRGGAITEQPPRRLRYPCAAHDCPMPGTIFPGAVQGEKVSGGMCAWHYGATPTDWPRISRVLLDWACVSFEITEARRVMTGDMATNPKAIHDAFDAAWQRMKPLVPPAWRAELQPGNIRTSKGVERPFREGYGDWAKRLERFIGSRISEVLSSRQRRSA